MKNRIGHDGFGYFYQLVKIALAFQWNIILHEYFGHQWLYVMVIYEYLEHVGLFTWSSWFIQHWVRFCASTSMLQTSSKVTSPHQKNNLCKRVTESEVDIKFPHQVMKTLNWPLRRNIDIAHKRRCVWLFTTLKFLPLEIKKETKLTEKTGF